MAPPGGLARSLARGLYLPTLLSEIGIGAAMPLFALSALELGEPAAIASLAVAVYGAGRLLGSAFGGVFATRAGPVPATLVAYGVLTVGAVAAALATGIALLGVGVFVLGVGHAAVHVARQTHLDAVTPVHARARALTTLAGVWRVGNFVGPFVGAALIHAWGLRAGYVLAAGAVVLGVIALVIAAPQGLSVPRHERQPVRVGAILRPQARVLATLGLGVLLLGAARQARVVVIPLWADHVGMSPSATSLVFGLATAIDMAMFLPAGWVMDRWGRRWTAVPSALALALGAAVLPFTHAPWQVAIGAVLVGFGNGWGSGVVMTLGADAAPEEGRAVFLGAWSILQDVGGLLGPAVVAAGAAVSLAVGLFAVSGIGVAAAGAMQRWVPRRVVPDVGPR